MKKVIFLFLCVGMVCQSFGQKYFTKTGTLNFEASVPAFEPVKAENSTTTSILDISTGKVAVLALIKGFRFKNALMEEHFNENYIESDKYPKATFNGTIKDFSIGNLDSKKEFTASGDLTIHGKTKAIDVTIMLIKKDDTFLLETQFSVAPGDFDIDIPGVVKEKISDKINISGSFELIKR